MDATRRRLSRIAIASLAMVGCAGGGADEGPTPTDATAVDVGLDAAALDARDASMDTSFDGGIVDAPPSDATLAGTYAPVLTEIDVAPLANRRIPNVTYDPAAQAFVAVYTSVEAGRHRSFARVVRFADGALDASSVPFMSAPLGVEDIVDPLQDSLGPAVAAGPTASSHVLVVYEDSRLGAAAGGPVEIYGAFLQAAGGATPTITKVGKDLDLSQRPATNETHAAVAYDPVGDQWYVAWADDRDLGPIADGRVVYARTVSATGVVGAEQRMGGAALYQDEPQISVAPAARRILVVWHDYVDSGSGLVNQEEARVIDAATGLPIGAPIRLANVGVPTDPAAIAFDDRRGEWLVAWTQAGTPSKRQIEGVRIGTDGAMKGAPAMLTAQPDGAMVPELAYAHATHSFLLAWHAFDSTDAYAVELDPDARKVGAVRALNPAPPSLGTFWLAAAADVARPRIFVLTNVNYTRIVGNLFVSPSALPPG